MFVAATRLTDAKVDIAVSCTRFKALYYDHKTGSCVQHVFKNVRGDTFTSF